MKQWDTLRQRPRMLAYLSHYGWCIEAIDEL